MSRAQALLNLIEGKDVLKCGFSLFTGDEGDQADVVTVEKNAVAFVKKKLGTAKGTGRRKDGRYVGTCSVDRSSKAAYDYVMQHSQIPMDSRTPEEVDIPPEDVKILLKGVSKEGMKTLDVTLFFTNIPKPEFDKWNKGK